MIEKIKNMDLALIDENSRESTPKKKHVRNNSSFKETSDGGKSKKAILNALGPVV
jgi:hypothetical protein